MCIFFYGLYIIFYLSCRRTVFSMFRTNRTVNVQSFIANNFFVRKGIICLKMDPFRRKGARSYFSFSRIFSIYSRHVNMF